MKAHRQTPCKILSALIVLTTLNIRLIDVHARLWIPSYRPLQNAADGSFSISWPGPLPPALRIMEICGWLLILYIHVFPALTPRKISTTRGKILEDGVSLLQIFLGTTVIESVFSIAVLSAGLAALNGPAAPYDGREYALVWLRHLLIVFLTELTLFWNGILRVYLTSVQLGVKWRVIGIICGWIPIVHIYALHRIISITSNEVFYENEKYLLDQVRAENEECKTRYPILLVHGVFFRDFRFFNYWGRIPAELIRNGATVYYGNQQSAASVADCGAELAERIRQIVQDTGCGKVNIIAHSKGGLDSRFAVAKCGAADYVASLTTVNTPHRGCMFADHLLHTIPDRICQSVAAKYNAALKRFGDSDPDFMEAVQDLTASSCARFNETVPDSPKVYYQSIGSVMNHASGGRFPLNVMYPYVRHYDGANDGLVAAESMKWGSGFHSLSVPKGRGISHGDMIDLNRENIPGFDVREFYVRLVHDLKGMGF